MRSLRTLSSVLQSGANGGSRGVFSMNYTITVVEKETFADILESSLVQTNTYGELLRKGGTAEAEARRDQAERREDVHGGQPGKGARADGDAETGRAVAGGDEASDDQHARHVCLGARARLRYNAGRWYE